MILTMSDQVIQWCVENKIACTPLFIEKLVSMGIDTDSPHVLETVRRVEDKYIESIESTTPTMRDLRVSLGYEWDDSSHDSEILNMSEYEALDALLRHKGIIGYTPKILEWISGIKNLNSKNATNKTEEFK